MEWWNNLVDWLQSDTGWRVISTAVIPFVAIVLAGIIAALIGRGSSKRVIAMTEQERRTSTVGALISGARRASKWNSLSLPEQQHAEHLLHEADTRIRMLPLNGSSMVADWAAHEIADMKRNSVSFSFQAEQSLIEFRNRLVEWQAKPGRAKKLFKSDLDTWSYEAGQAEQDLVRQQTEWAKQQVESPRAAETSAPAAASPAAAAPAAATPVVAAAATPTANEPFVSPEYTLPESVAKREADGPVEDWTGATDVTSSSAASDAAAPSGAPADSEPEAVVTDSGSDDDYGDETPGPVSAGTVRQRIDPEQREDY